ncbi:MAG: helix-turn-helix transcriptional regulator [bacterium]|nr:helix-turn-helix transcriptional regulator [bacterium]
MVNNSNLSRFVADRVRQIRKERKLTQEALSEASKLDIKYVNKFENYRHSARLETLESLLEALGITYSEFFNFDIKADMALVEELLVVLSKLPKEKQEKKIKALIALIEE